jgi:hypothetical protein
MISKNRSENYLSWAAAHIGIAIVVSALAINLLAGAKFMTASLLTAKYS